MKCRREIESRFGEAETAVNPFYSVVNGEDDRGLHRKLPDFPNNQAEFYFRKFSENGYKIIIVIIKWFKSRWGRRDLFLGQNTPTKGRAG